MTVVLASLMVWIVEIVEIVAVLSAIGLLEECFAEATEIEKQKT